MAELFSQNGQAHEPKPVDVLSRAAWQALTLFAFLTIVTLGILALAYTGKGPMRSVGYAKSTQPLQIVISNDVFNVPENMIRHQQQRYEGVADRLDLAVLWPTGQGYSEATLADFADTNPDTVRTVLVGISKRQSLLDMSMRFHPVLKRALVSNSMTKAENGLMEAALDPQFGFMNETLLFSSARKPGGDPQFVVRCHRNGTDAALLHACETDLFIGTSSVATVRFARHHLADWQRFNMWLQNLLKSLALERAA